MTGGGDSRGEGQKESGVVVQRFDSQGHFRDDVESETGMKREIDI
jgi:hypothetical protein